MTVYDSASFVAIKRGQRVGARERRLADVIRLVYDAAVKLAERQQTPMIRRAQQKHGPTEERLRYLRVCRLPSFCGGVLPRPIPDTERRG